MSRSEIIFQLVCFMLPSIAFFASAYIFVQKWGEVQKEKSKIDAAAIQQGKTSSGGVAVSVSGENKKVFFPMQVEAYQRIVLFLERIAPNNIIMRLNNPALPGRAFQQVLLDSIRNEYEHNLAQQIFISTEAWELVKNSKEDVIKIVNMAASKLPATATCIDLSRGVFEITAQLKNQPTDRAILYLKAELENLVAQG